MMAHAVIMSPPPLNFRNLFGYPVAPLPAIVLVLTCPVPEIGGLVGDRVILRPDRPRRVVLQRDLPDNAALQIAALDAGRFEVLTPHALPEARAALRIVGGTPVHPAGPPGPVRRWLRRLK
jgi:hypothetical protein